jgi:hypothetical protein
MSRSNDLGGREAGVFKARVEMARTRSKCGGPSDWLTMNRENCRR